MVSSPAYTSHIHIDSEADGWEEMQRRSGRVSPSRLTYNQCWLRLLVAVVAKEWPEFLTRAKGFWGTEALERWRAEPR